MNTVGAVQNYVEKFLAEVNGMKVLLLDSETTPVISAVYSQSQLLQKQVFLIDSIVNSSREKLSHLKCICFVRPTDATIQNLIDELRSPKYGEYHLYFSNIIKKSQLERLAEADQFEKVKQVQEFFADFIALSNESFVVNMDSLKIYGESQTSPNPWNPNALARTTEGLVSLLLSLKKRPIIRYQKNSNISKKLASEILFMMQQEAALFDFRRADTPPVLLILDRKFDPITPVLNQWTYQAMVHELIGIKNGRVNLSNVPNVREELKDIVLTPVSDPFFKSNMYLNLGDLGSTIKTYVDDFQAKHSSTMAIESIQDMKRFVENYPEFRQLSGNVTKHVTLVGELSRLVEKNKLLGVGELEQSLVCGSDHQGDLKAIQAMLSSDVPAYQKSKLVMLYCLRYPNSPSFSGLLEQLRSQGIGERDISSIQVLSRYAEGFEREDSVFEKTKNVFKGLKGVENIYTQHVPPIYNLLENMVKGKLKESSYPFLDEPVKDKPQDVIVYVVGGITYAEVKEVARLREAYPSARIILGGGDVLNSQSFINFIVDSASYL